MIFNIKDIYLKSEWFYTLLGCYLAVATINNVFVRTTLEE